ADLAIHRHTRRNELYVMGSRARSGARVHALTADVEAVTGVDPLRLPAIELPAGATWVDDVSAAIDAARARREEVEAVTIREIAARVEHSSTKEALGGRKMQAGPTWDGARQDVVRRREADASERHGLRERRTALMWERSWTRDRQEAASRAQGTEQEQARPELEAEHPIEPLPARQAIESVARARLHDMDTSSALALYAVAGRLLEAEDPAELAARKWGSDREAAIVVADEELEQRVRAAVVQVQSASDSLAGSPDSPAPEHHALADPLIVQARDGYAARRERRERWLASGGTARENGHQVEPEALPRAYVVAREARSSPSLVRAVSVAAGSPPVVPSLRPGLP